MSLKYNSEKHLNAINAISDLFQMETAAQEQRQTPTARPLPP